MKTSKERTVFFLESDLKKKAVEYAKKDRRSLTVLINIAVEEYLKRNAMGKENEGEDNEEM
jgi:predicted transcriptional regulator